MDECFTRRFRAVGWFLGNDELQLEEIDALAREVTSADIASSE